MFIEHLFYQENEENKKNRIQIRDRFIEYFQDSHHRYHIPLDKKTIPSFGHRHHELGNGLFDLIKEKINFCAYDYIIFPSRSVSIDPDYVSHVLDLISQPMKFKINQCILCCSVEIAGSPDEMLKIAS